MRNQDRDRFGRLVVALSVATRGDVDEAVMELYFRALRDVPIELLITAAEELTATAKFFPKPVEWRERVDDILDRRQNQRALAGAAQAQLPGEILEYRCESCDNTGWVGGDEPCTKGDRCGHYKDAGHTHPVARRCENKYCVEARTQDAERRKRYAADSDWRPVEGPQVGKPGVDR